MCPPRWQIIAAWGPVPAIHFTCACGCAYRGAYGAPDGAYGAPVAPAP